MITCAKVSSIKIIWAVSKRNTRTPSLCCRHNGDLCGIHPSAQFKRTTVTPLVSLHNRVVASTSWPMRITCHLSEGKKPRKLSSHLCLALPLEHALDFSRREEEDERHTTVVSSEHSVQCSKHCTCTSARSLSSETIETISKRKARTPSLCCRHNGDLRGLNPSAQVKSLQERLLHLFAISIIEQLSRQPGLCKYISSPLRSQEAS